MQDRKIPGLHGCSLNCFISLTPQYLISDSFYYFVTLLRIFSVYCKFEDQILIKLDAASKGRVTFQGDLYLEEVTTVSTSAFQSQIFVNTKNGSISGMNSH